MTKKILTLVMVLSFILAFAACDKDNTTSEASKDNSTVSAEITTSAEESEDTTSAEESKAASEDESSVETLSGVVDGTYYGDGYSFTVPEGFTFAGDENKIALFMSTNGSSINIIPQTIPNCNTVLDNITKEQFEQMFAAFLDNITVNELEHTTINDSKAIKASSTMNANGIEMDCIQYMVCSETTLYTITYTTLDNKTLDVIDKLAKSFKMD